MRNGAYYVAGLDQPFDTTAEAIEAAREHAATVQQPVVVTWGHQGTRLWQVRPDGTVDTWQGGAWYACGDPLVDGDTGRPDGYSCRGW